MPHETMTRASDPCLIFRLNDCGQGPEIIQEVFMEKGWLQYDEDVHEEHEWNLWWRTSRFRNSDYDQLDSWQWLNHYPRSTAITKKDCLARNLKRMKGVYGPVAYDFSPIAFNLPNDYTRFVAEYTKQKENARDMCWICKPADLSRGRGIFIFKELSELQYDFNAVIQQYITDPLLIGGYKFDLRIYVMVPSFQPLQVYIYEEGLVRFSTEKFDLNSLSNQYAHLTNTSINKHSPNYGVDKERVGAGCKWTLRQLRHYFHQTGIDDNPLWGKIINIVIMTIIIQAGQVPKVDHCFELYGFDIMVNDKLKPWLLEVNFSPALSSDCQVDVIVKKSMLHDLFDMMQFREEDKLHGDDKPQKQPRKSYGLSLSRVGRNERTPHRATAGVGQAERRIHGVGQSDSKSHGHVSSIAHSERNKLVATSGMVHSERKPPVSYSQKKESSRLPRIIHSYSTSTIGGSLPDTEEGDSDSEPKVIPIIPGCGLPSVQQTTLQIPAPSPASSSPLSDLDDGYGSTSGKSRTAKSASNTITQISTNQNITYRSTNQNVIYRSADHRSKTPFQHPSQSVQQKTGHDQTHSKYQMGKRDSKYSIQSDSGVSSFSGTSEPADSTSQTQRGDTSELTSVVGKTEHAPGKRESPSCKSTVLGNSRDTSADIDDTTSSPKSGHSVNRLSMPQLSVSKRPPISSRSVPNRSNKLNGNQISNQSLKLHNSPFTARSLSQKSDNYQPTHKLSTGGAAQQQLPIRSSRRRRPLHVEEEPVCNVTPRIGTRCPPERVGDFFRVFPFNETTKKCSLGNLDIKSIIRECKQLFKERLKVMKRQGQTDDLNTQDRMTPPKVLDVQLLWKPLQGDAPAH